MDLEQTAMERLRLASDMSQRLYKQPLVITYSGGKDSDCLLRLVEKEKAAQIEKRRPEFEKTVAPLEAWSWQDAGICIRPVHTEEELMDEGSALNHCVGGYGPTVARGGSCIFFIRHADQPDVSWYTLQVELTTLREIQNHGRNNCPPTEEVQEFVNRWLEHVRQLPAAGKKRKKKETAA